MSDLAANFARVRATIDSAEKEYQRTPGSVKLLAVSKSRKPQALLEATREGCYCFAENYLQELQEKVAYLSQQTLAQKLEWHFIGAIQSKKARAIAALCDWVHSIDRLAIAEKLSKHRPQNLPPLNLCIQVNLDNEASKSGILPHAIAELSESIASLPGLRLRGLMAIPKPCVDIEKQRQGFADLQSLYRDLAQQIPSVDSLSAGMSGDFEMAIAEGSTMVRVGTALFGPR